MPWLLTALCVQAADADHLGAVSTLAGRPVLLAVAAWFPSRDGGGPVRLIDNVVLGGDLL